MGVDLATIGVGVDTTDLARGEAHLDQFADEGERTEKRINKSADGMSKKLGDLKGVTKTTATGIKATGAAAKTAGGNMRSATADAVKYTNATRASTMQTANLTAQFNDIGVMLAAGQNPLQLAMQQGTQINQVFQQMGGGVGAVRSLGPALMSMVSPMSLLTLGTIAGGAALFNWGRNALGASGDAKTFEESLEDVNAALDRYQAASDAAGMSTADLMDQYGAANQGLRSTLALLEELAQNESQRAIDGVTQSLAELFAISGDGDDRTGIAAFYDVDIFLAFTKAQREARSEARQFTAELLNGQNALKAAAGDPEAQVEALQRMIAAAETLSDIDGERSAEEEKVLQQMAEALLAAQGMIKVKNDTSAATQEMADAERLLGQQMIDNLANQELARLKGQELVANLVREAELQTAIALHGENSLQVEALRAEAQRASLAAKLEELGVTEEVKNELLAAAQAAWDVEAGAVAASGAISSAANEASRMASEIQRAVNAMINLGAQGVSSLRQSEIRLQHKGDPVATAGALAKEKFGDVSGFDPLLRGELEQQRDAFVKNAEATEENRQALIKWQKEQAKAAGGSKGGGGKKTKGGLNEHLREAESLFRATRTPAEQYAAELAKINELHKMGLIDADTYGRAMEDLEGKYSEAGKAAGKMEDMTETLFVDMLSDIENADNAVEGFIRTLGRMALQAAFSGIFKGVFSGLGGIFGSTASGQGNVFESGHRVAFGQGGVVNGRTTFPMANGQTGEAGEIGPEAIMPLKRGSDGKLGVSVDMPTSVPTPIVAQGDQISVVFAPNIDATGADPAELRRTQEKLAEMEMSLDDRVIGAVAKGKKRRLL